jgi:hypothetical protein
MGVWSASVRIDIAVINGELSGFELKSDRDTLERLPLQAELYSRVFDRVDLVVGRRLAETAIRSVPEWWGISIAKQKGETIEFEDRRCGKLNPTPDPYLIAQLLWKDEALKVLDQFDLAAGWRSKRIKLIHQRLAAELPITDLKERVRIALKRREGWLKANSPAPIRCAG